jgi:hypothetical protein
MLQKLPELQFRDYFVSWPPAHRARVLDFLHRLQQLPRETWVLEGLESEAEGCADYANRTTVEERRAIDRGEE